MLTTAPRDDEMVPGEKKLLTEKLTAVALEDRCKCCLGRGHTALRCSTKQRMDAWCKKVGFRRGWGLMKYHTWYKSTVSTYPEVRQAFDKLRQSCAIKKKPNRFQRRR